MAEKDNFKRRSAAARSSNSKISTLARPVRVVHISNPIVVKASASEFGTVVKSLTGLKRSSVSHNRDVNLNSDQYGPQVKVPKIQDGLHCSKDMKTSESALIHDKATVSECRNEKDHGDVRIFEDLEVLPIQSPDYIPSQNQMVEIPECFGDGTHLFFPSILSSDLEYP